MMQQLTFGRGASMGASIYENEFVKEDGVWKFSVDQRTTRGGRPTTAAGWQTAARVPGPSQTYPPDTPPTFKFQMFPNVYEIPFHYASSRDGQAPRLMRRTCFARVSPCGERLELIAPRAPGARRMPAEIEAQLR